jgi:glycosyltransferase involved in cell wall biosynthesis
VTVDAEDPYARINLFARAATGDCLLALGASTAARSAILDSVRATASTWTVILAETSRCELQKSLLAEAVTTGFALLAQTRLVDSADCLLVPRTLHEAVSGYRPETADPLLDYCLRLLWRAEPLLAGYTAEAGNPPPVRSPDGNPAEPFDNYLHLAATAEASPNPFAPARCNWGLRFASHVINQQLFPTAETLAAIAGEIAAYLERKCTSPISTTPGVNLVGPARDEFGLAENMRAFARASLEGDIPCVVRDLNLALGTRQGDDSLSDYFAEDARHDCSIFFVNPDWQFYEQSLDAVVFRRPTLDFRHVKIGYWFWELEKLPVPWSDAIRKVDEIWVATEFVAEAIRRETTKPVIKIPTPIGFELKQSYNRSYFDLPDGIFLFLFSFDFNSFAERKNPYGLIRAFRRAFPLERKDVGLVVKSINGAKKAGAIEALLDSANNDPRIMLRDGFLSRDEVYGLQSVADAYVSLHRAEGLGLGLAECMYQGKPVIGTGYSGNLEFMNEANSALVRYSLTPIKKGEYLYDDPGFFWAEPDEDHAAHLMRKMVDAPDYRRALAEHGQRDIRSRFNNKTTAALMRTRLAEIGVL